MHRSLWRSKDPQHPTRSQVLEQIYEQDAYTKEHKKKGDKLPSRLSPYAEGDHYVAIKESRCSTRRTRAKRRRSHDRDPLLTEDQIHGELTYVSSITLEPGCSIGVHTHSGDNEMYYIYEGTGTYTDGDETYPVQAGDVLFCNDGETHGIANEGNAPLRFVALMQATA